MLFRSVSQSRYTEEQKARIDEINNQIKNLTIQKETLDTTAEAGKIKAIDGLINRLNTELQSLTAQPTVTTQAAEAPQAAAQEQINAIQTQIDDLRTQQAAETDPDKIAITNNTIASLEANIASIKAGIKPTAAITPTKHSNLSDEQLQSNLSNLNNIIATTDKDALPEEKRNEILTNITELETEIKNRKTQQATPGTLRITYAKEDELAEVAGIESEIMPPTVEAAPPITKIPTISPELQAINTQIILS